MVERKERRRKETKPRRKSVASLIEVAQKRGLKIKRLNPDGSVDIGEPEEKDEKGEREIIL